MPELPEVETTAAALRPLLNGRRIRSVSITDERLVRPRDPRQIEALLTGRRILDVGRRGKYLTWRLDRDMAAVWHLRMTGSFRWFESRDLSGSAGTASDDDVDSGVSHVRARVNVVGGVVAFRDVRRFGTLVVDRWDLLSRELEAKLGPEPLDPSFSAEELMAAMRGRSTPIKSALLMQHLIAGVGNIYADEALFAAGIDPRSPAGSIGLADIRRLHAELQRVLRAGIAAGGSTLRDYRSVEGGDGTMQESFAAYGRAGLPCLVCGQTMSSAQIAGRTTTWCPRCQPSDR